MVLVSCLVAGPAYAARVAGVILDASGAPVAGATVSAGGASATTADDGSFEIRKA